MATKKKARKKRAAPRKKTARRRAVKHAKKRARKRPVKRTRKRTVKRKARRAPKRAVKRKKKPARRKTAKRKTAKRKTTKRKTTKRKTAKRKTAKRKVGRKVRRKTARKPARKARRKIARKRPKASVRRKKKPARRKARVIARKPARRRKPVRRKKPARRLPKAPAAAARKPAQGFTLRRLAAKLGPSIKPPIEAYSGNKPYIFASYSHKNIKEVFWCIKKLAESRYRIWYDEGIEPGNEWPEEVGRALTGCQLFMVFMSPAAMDSRNVRNEINFASSENKSMMVVMLQPAGLSEGMQLQIGTVQTVNKHEMTDTEFLEKMKKVLDPSLRL